MSFHVYIEPELQQKLELFCQRTGRKRNAVMREALRNFLEQSTQITWPEAVFSFKPYPELDSFESMRSDFPPERKDIFSTDK
ncbi:MAG: hypothetical protein ACRD3W_03120 [Terriglobales bacterium]